MSQAEEEPVSVRSISAPLLPEAATEENSTAAAGSSRSRHGSGGTVSSVHSGPGSSRSSSREGSTAGSLTGRSSGSSSSGAGFVGTAVSALRRLRRRIQGRLLRPRQAWRPRARRPRDATNSNMASGGPTAERIRNTNARRVVGGRRGHSRSRSRTNGEESSARLRLKALRAVLRSRGAVSRQIVSRAAEAAALAGGDEISLAGGTNVWDGVFTSLSPTDTGGVFCSLLCALLLALCLFFCTESAQPSLLRSKQEMLVWAFVQTVSSLILNYASFLGAICMLAVFQLRHVRARQQRRLQLRLQREWMRHVREVCEDMQRRGQAGPPQSEQKQQQQQQPTQQDQKQQQHQKQQPKTQQQQPGSSQNNTVSFYGNNANNEDMAKVRKSSAELLQMLSELERLAALELRLDATDSELEELAAQPEKIGSAWVSADCRASLYRARGQEDAAYARLQLM